MMFYICTKFHENISKGFRVIRKFSKGHNTVKNVGGVPVFVLCIASSDDVLYLYQI